MKNAKELNAKSHIEIKYRNVNVNFKANLVASRKLIDIDHSYDMIDHLLD